MIGLAIGLAFCGVYFSSILLPLEEKLLDQQQKIPLSSPTNRIPIVFIGIEDMEDTPWPWPRLDYTLMANSLRRFYPKLVAFEIPLEQPDTLYPIYDTQLAQYLSKLNLVVLAGTAQFSESETAPLPDNVFPILVDLPATFLQPYDTAQWPLTSFREFASIGMQNLNPDDDGTVRRIPLLFRVGPNFYPSFSLQCYAQFMGAHWPSCKIEPGKKVTLCDATGKIILVIPIDDFGEARVRFRPEPPITPHFEFKNVLLASEQELGTSAPVYDLSVLRNKLVVIGRNHRDAIPYLKTPLGEFSPAQIHLTALTNFFSDDFIINLPRIWVCIWLLSLSLIMALLPCWTETGSGLALCWTLLLVTATLCLILFDAFNLWTPTITLLLTGFTSWFAASLLDKAFPLKSVNLAPPAPSKSKSSNAAKED